jgi:endoglucanase
LKQIALLPLALFAALAACTPPKRVALEPALTTGESALRTGPQLRGVNRSGAEWGIEWNGWQDEEHPHYFEWPSVTVRTKEFDYFESKGMNVIRLPISWERIQHTLNGPLDPKYQDDLVKYVTAATSRGFAVIIDLHNYGRYATGAHNASDVEVKTGYTQHRLGDGTLKFEHVADVWRRIAMISDIISNPRVIFNLMNEQHDADPSLDSRAIFTGYQTVLDAVRATGAKQLVLFPNTRSSDTHHWSTWSPQGGPLDSDNLSPPYETALKVKDSADNLAFDMHSYEGCTVCTPTCVACDKWTPSPSQPNSDIKVVTDWARANGKRLFLSEFGTESGATVVSTLLRCINSNPDVWVGWTVWNLHPYWISVTDRSTGVVSDTEKMPWYAPYFATTPPTPSDRDCDGIPDP